MIAIRERFDKVALQKKNKKIENKPLLTHQSRCCTKGLLLRIFLFSIFKKQTKLLMTWSYTIIIIRKLVVNKNFVIIKIPCPAACAAQERAEVETMTMTTRRWSQAAKEKSQKILGIGNNAKTLNFKSKQTLCKDGENITRDKRQTKKLANSAKIKRKLRTTSVAANYSKNKNIKTQSCKKVCLHFSRKNCS